MDIQIEDLKYEDIEECYKMNMEIFDEDRNLEEIKTLYQKYSNMKDTYRYLVAKVNGKIVGYTSCIIGYNLFDGKHPFMTLWYVCTHPDYRRKGVATKLFECIEEIAKDNNCELIYFTSEMYRKGAHTFYEKMGYNQNESKAFIKYL